MDSVPKFWAISCWKTVKIISIEAAVISMVKIAVDPPAVTGANAIAIASKKIRIPSNRWLELILLLILYKSIAGTVIFCPAWNPYWGKSSFIDITTSSNGLPLNSLNLGVIFKKSEYSSVNIMFSPSKSVPILFWRLSVKFVLYNSNTLVEATS